MLHSLLKKIHGISYICCHLWLPQISEYKVESWLLLNLNLQDFNPSWSPISYYCFDLKWPFLMNWHETTWLASRFPHSPPLSEANFFCVWWNKTCLQSFDAYYVSIKKFYIIKIKLSWFVYFSLQFCIYYWHFVSCCKQRVISHWNCILIFVIPTIMKVLSVSIYQKHQDSTYLTEGTNL
jgi:hypothetical protein